MEPQEATIMDRFIRQPVDGTWAKRPLPAPDARDVAHERDPRGWANHHAVYQHSFLQPLGPEELLDAVRMRAYELYTDRVRTGRHGSAVDDWLRAEREVMATQRELIRRSGEHAAVPPGRP
jgi:hypothetical protein